MGRWPVRSVSEDLVERYVAAGWWRDETLGEAVAARLGAMAGATFAAHSAVRPWRGTVGELDRQARRFAGWLRSRGIGPNDTVVFQLPNWAEAAVTFWGAALAGAIVVPVVHFYGRKELAYIVGATSPSIVITADEFGRADYLESYRDLLGPLDAPWVVVGDRAPGGRPGGCLPFDAVLDADPVRRPAAADPDEPALVAFTSGTTSDPKGVIHSHRTIDFEARQLAAMTDRGGPPPITGAPVGHFIGMLNGLVCSLVRSNPINLIDVWDPGEVLRLMDTEDLGVAGGSTYFLTSILDHPDFTDAHLRSMPSAGLGGSPIPAAVTERATAMGIKVFRSYGSTEHPSMTGCTLEDPADKRLHTDGRALPGVEVRLDEDGQILSRGPDLFLGYTDADLTRHVFDDDGWYRTGDIGAIDDDGYLSITDRISDVIIRGGENISAQEVEDLLLGMAGVAEVAVVAEPDDRLGERAAAVVRRRDGETAPTLADVRAHLAAAGLARQKWPESIHVVDELPRTPSGKVQKYVLRRRLRGDERPA